MKKYLSLLIVLAVVISGAKVARAEGRGPNPGPMRDPRGPLEFIRDLKESRGEIRKEAKDKMEALKAQRDGMRKEMKEKVKASREEAREKMRALRESIKTERDSFKARTAEARITGREKALERFDKIIDNMSSMVEKINQRAALLQDKGVDTSAAEALLDAADAKLASAKEKVTEINAILANSIDKLSAEDKATLRTLAQGTQGLIKEAHQDLRDAVKALKDAVKEKIESSRGEAEAEDEVEND